MAAQQSITPIMYQDQKAWLKGVPIKKQQLSHCIKKKLLSLLMMDNIVKPTVACGLEDIDTEVRRLQQAHTSHINAPQVLATGPNYIILSDLGDTLESQLNIASPSQQLYLLYKAQQALLRIHAAGIIHGRGMVKDLVVSEAGQIGFIDFAEDPLKVMSLDQAKTRDWLCFLLTALPFIDDAARSEFVISIIDPLPTREAKLLCKFYNKFNFILLIGKILKPYLGQDAKRALLLFKHLKIYYESTALKTPQRFIPDKSASHSSVIN